LCDGVERQFPARKRRAGSIAKVGSQPVYNVDIAELADLFVGAKGILVHDFSFVSSVTEPFDRYPELPQPTTSAKPQTNRSMSQSGSDDRNAHP
jgi:hypothetical protein